MAILSFAGKSGSERNAAWANLQPIYTDGISGITAREASDGSRPWLISSMRLYVAGRGGTRTVTPFVANVGGTNLDNLPAKSIASSASAQPHDFPASILRTSTGQLRVGFNNGLTGGVYFGRNTVAGSTIVVTGGDNWAGSALSGHIVYAQVPTAPRTLTGSNSGNVVTLNWVAPASNGDSAITGYRVEYSHDDGATWTDKTVGDVLTDTLTLTAGETYIFRVSALNAVTTAQGTWSLYSNTISIETANARTVFVDSLLITQDISSAIPFFDGNSLDGTWDGTPNNSKSAIINAELEPLYDALADDNNIMSVDVSTTQTYDLTLRGIYAGEIYNPTAVDTVGEVIAGQYTITASDNLPVVASQWVQHGGEVIASANTAGGLVITIQGPAEIPGVPGPFSLTRSDGASQYANLKIAGTGIITKPETITVYTGANPKHIVNEIANTISSPYIVDIEDAYTVAVANSYLSNGTLPELSLTFSLDDVHQYGLLIGGIIEWRNAIWRLREISYSTISATGTFELHTKNENFNDAWSAYDVGYFNNVWAGKQTRHFKREPLNVGQ